MFKQGAPLRKSSTSESHVGSRVRRFVLVLWRHSPSWSHWCLYICLCLCLLSLCLCFCLCLLYLSLSEWEGFCFTCNTLTYGSLVPLLAITFVFEALSLDYSQSNDAWDVPLVILWQNLSIGRSPVALWMLSTSRMYGALAIFGFDFFDLWWKLSEFSRWLDYVRSLHLKIVFAISIEGSLASILKICLCSRHFGYLEQIWEIWKNLRGRQLWSACLVLCAAMVYNVCGKKHHNLITRDKFLQTEFQTIYSPNPLYSWHCKSKLLQIYCLN